MERKMFRKMIPLLGLLLLVPITFLYADYKLGIQYFKQGKFVEAASEFQAEVDMAPNYDYGYYMLGMCYLKLGKLDIATENFKKAIDLTAEKFDYHYGLAQVYLKRKEYYQVVNTLNAAANLAKTQPQQYALSYLRGIGYSGKKKYAEAVEDLKKARQIKADQTILEQLGKSCYQIGDSDCAIAAFKDALKIDPNSYEAVFYLSSSLIEKAQREENASKKKSVYAEAVKYSEMATKMKPNDIESLNLCGRANLGARNFNVAIEKFKEVIKQRPNYCWAMVNIAKAYIPQKKWMDAESWLQKAVNCDVRSVVALETLGFVIMKQGEDRLEESLEVFEKAKSIKSTPSIENNIAIVKNKIETRNYNLKLEEEQKKLQELDEKKRKEYEEEKKKVEKWKKKQEEAR